MNQAHECESRSRNLAPKKALWWLILLPALLHAQAPRDAAPNSCSAVPAESCRLLLCNGFEPPMSAGACSGGGKASNPFGSPWDYCTPSSQNHLNIITAGAPAPTAIDGTRVADIQYTCRGVPQDEQCDVNLYFQKNFPANTQHVAVRGYVYFSSAAKPLYGQRKIYYFKNPEETGFVVLTSDVTSYSVSRCNQAERLKLRVDYGPNEQGDESPLFSTGSGCNLAFDSWHSVEIEIQLNSCERCNDGFINTWVDGVQDEGMSAAHLRVMDAASPGIGKVEVGRQFDPWQCSGSRCQPSNTGDEHRYWDHLAIAAGAQIASPCPSTGCIGRDP